MPIYQYQCLKTQEIVEEIVPLVLCGKPEELVLCPLHILDKDYFNGEYPDHHAEKVWSTPANINIGKPTIIFRNPRTGETEVAVHDQDTPRHGFVREELRNPIERSKFEKETQARQDLANELVTEKLKQDHAETRKNRHADIESRMSSIPNDGTREFLRKVMSRKSKRKFPEKKSQVKLTVNHTDSSNLIK